MSPPELVPIGTFARSARLTVKALRHYHRTGLLVPAHVDPSTGYRSYAWDQLGDALLITSLRELDLPLEQIRSHLVDDVPLRELLAAEREELERRAARLRRALVVVDALAERSSFPELEVDTVTWDRTTTRCISAELDGDSLGAGASRLIDELLQRSGGTGSPSTEPVIAAYPVTLDGAVHVTVHVVPADARDADGRGAGADRRGRDARRLADELAVREGTLAGGRLARVVHVGPHEALPIAYHSLIRELTARGEALDGPIYERYLDDPAQVAPEQLRTEVLHRIDVTPER